MFGICIALLRPPNCFQLTGNQPKFSGWNAMWTWSVTAVLLGIKSSPHPWSRKRF